MSLSLRFAAGLVALSALAAPAAAADADPAAAQIEQLNNAILEALPQARTLDMQSRYVRLAPAVDNAFDLPAITRLAVGTQWTSYSAQDQAALVRAVTRFSVATAAKNLDAYDGQRLVVDPVVDTRGPDKLVRSKIISRGGIPTDLTYRMRQAPDGRWKVIDVFHKGAVSELAARKSDFAATLESGGPMALVAKLEAQSDQLMGGG